MFADTFERLIAHYENAEDARLQNATVEDIALLVALRDSYPEDSTERTRLAFAGGCAKRWVDLMNSPSAGPVEEVRLQPLLRACLDQSQQGGAQDISPDQAHLLHAASELLARLNDATRYARLVELLRPHAGTLRNLIATPPMPGLESLAEQVTIIDSELLSSAPRREVSSFAGLAMLSRGHVLDCTGPVKVLDGIPHDCTLVVQNGSCLINGHVEGQVAAAVDIEVRGNHAGVAIVSQGSIHVGACLNKSTAVSKSGSILARRCEDPKMVFAGDRITILGDTRGGTYMAPTIEIQGIASGGNYRIARTLHAKRFVPLAGRGPVIELQRRVACEEVGKLIPDEASRVFSRLAGVRTSMRNTDRLVDVARHESENYATKALIYLFNGESNREQLEELDRLERRLSVINRIIAGIEVLAETAEDRISRGANSDARNDAWKEIESELTAELDETDSNADLGALQKELNAMARNLSRDSKISPADTLTRLRGKRLTFLLERKELQRNISEIEKEMGESRSGFVSHERFLTDAPRLDVLSRVIQTARSRPPEERLYQRVQSPFVQLMLKSIEARRKRIRHYMNLHTVYKREYDSLSEKLLRQFHLNPPSLASDDEVVMPQVSGFFEDGVTLCTEAALLEKPESQGAAVLSPSGIPGERTYRRENDAIVEVAAE